MEAPDATVRTGAFTIVHTLPNTINIAGIAEYAPGITMVTTGLTASASHSRGATTDPLRTYLLFHDEHACICGYELVVPQTVNEIQILATAIGVVTYMQSFIRGYIAGVSIQTDPQSQHNTMTAIVGAIVPVLCRIVPTRNEYDGAFCAMFKTTSAYVFLGCRCKRVVALTSPSAPITHTTARTMRGIAAISNIFNREHIRTHHGTIKMSGREQPVPTCEYCADPCSPATSTMCQCRSIYCSQQCQHLDFNLHRCSHVNGREYVRDVRRLAILLAVRLDSYVHGVTDTVDTELISSVITALRLVHSGEFLPPQAQTDLRPVTNSYVLMRDVVQLTAAAIAVVQATHQEQLYNEFYDAVEHLCDEIASVAHPNGIETRTVAIADL